MRVELSAEAQAQIERIDAWWREHPIAAPDLLAEVCPSGWLHKMRALGDAVRLDKALARRRGLSDVRNIAMATP